MHVRELVEVAGLVALNGPLVIQGSVPLATTQVDQYWSTSKGRSDDWHRWLKLCATRAAEPADQRRDTWTQVAAVFQEIFVSELLSRVWAAVLTARDRRAGTSTAEPVVRSVLDSHLEVRRRALGLLLQGSGFNTSQSVSLNRLRLRVDRWTDVLIGSLLHAGDVREFAVEHERAEDFAEDLEDRRGRPGALQAWRLTLVSLRNAFSTACSPEAASAEANARIAASVLGSFPGELFDSTGLFHSLWMVRLTANTSDAQGLITDLLKPNPYTHRAKEQARRRRI